MATKTTPKARKVTPKPAAPTTPPPEQYAKFGWCKQHLLQGMDNGTYSRVEAHNEIFCALDDIKEQMEKVAAVLDGISVLSDELEYCEDNDRGRLRLAIGCAADVCSSMLEESVKRAEFGRLVTLKSKRGKAAGKTSA